MPALREETPGRPSDVSALRPAVKRRRRIVLIVSAVLAIAVLCDWMRPPDRQVSVVLYNTIVVKGYRLLFQGWGRHFIRCRFRPTCSEYSRQAMEAHGFVRGIQLTTSRLFRCMPWVPYGTEDPVPPAK